MTATDERNLPADFTGCLPRAYDRRATPRPEVLTRQEYDRQFAASLRAMRKQLKEESSATQEN